MTANPRTSKAKGTTFERAVANYFRETGLFPSCERAPRWGSVDKGDLVNTGDFCFELKATRTIDLAGFVGEADVECNNAGKLYPVVVIKRRQKSIAESYVVMTLEDFVGLAHERNAYLPSAEEAAA